MGMEILANPHMKESQVISASSQRGQYIGQPNADADNSGSLTLASSGAYFGSGALSQKVRVTTAGDIETAKFVMSKKVDSGTVTSATANTLSDSSKAWDTDEWNGSLYRVEITSGTGVGQSRLISDTSSTQLTVSSNWTTTPTVGDKYEIYTWYGTNDEDVAGDGLVYVGDDSLNCVIGDLIPLSNNDLMVIMWDALSDIVYVRKYDVSEDSWGSLVTVNDGTENPPATGCQLANDRILVAYRHSATEIKIKYSDDLGTTWTDLGASDLDDFTNLNSTDSIVMRRSGSILCLVYKDGTRLYSRVSSDSGATWTAAAGIGNINTTNNALSPSMTVDIPSGKFCVAYEDSTSNDGYFESSANGLTWGDRAQISATDIDYGTALTYVRDGDKLLFHTCDTSENYVWAASINDGADWGTDADYDDKNYLNLLPFAAYRGNACAMVEWQEGVACGISDEIFGCWVMHLNNWSNVTQTLAYTETYYPIDEPDNDGWVRNPVAGPNAGDYGSVSNGILNIACTNQQCYYCHGVGGKDWYDNGDRDIGVVVRWAMRVNSGGSQTNDYCGFEIQLSDLTTNRVYISVRFNTTGVRVYDNLAAADVITFSHDFTDYHEFLLAMKDDDVAIWFRTLGKKNWKIIGTYGSLTTGAGTTSILSFGAMDNSCTSDADWRYVYYTTGGDDGLSDGFTNPDDLNARLTSSETQYLMDGVEIDWAGTGGVVNDEWDIDGAYSYPKEAILTDSLGDFWASESDDEEVTIILDAGAGNAFEFDAVGLCGINFKTATIEANDTNDWAAPKVTINLDSEVDTGTLEAAADYRARDDDKDWTPKKYGDEKHWFRFSSTSSSSLSVTKSSASSESVSVTKSSSSSFSVSVTKSSSSVSVPV